MLTNRLWELGIGSLLAFYELKYGRVKHELLNQTMPLLGLAMITYAIVFFNKQTPHPSFISLLPTIGTALIILYSINKTDLVGKVLSWKPIVGVGLISYSMYLWHYPLFAFARIADTNGLHNDEKYLLILLTIVLSIVSYFVIEKPFRNRHFLNIKKFSVAILLLLIAVLGANWKVIETKGWFDIEPIENFKEMVDKDKRSDLNKWVHERKNSLRIENKKTFTDEDDLKIMVIGDSNAGDFINSLYEINPKMFKLDIISVINPSACGGFFGVELTKYEHFRTSNGNKRKSSQCFDFNNEQFFKTAKKADVIFWGQAWQNWEAIFFEESFSNLKNKFGEKVYFILSKHIKNIKSKEEFIKILNEYRIKNELAELDVDEERTGKINSLIRNISNGKFIDYYEIVCNERKCPKILNGKVVMYDEFHLTPFGAKLFAKRLEEKGFIDTLIKIKRN